MDIPINIDMGMEKLEADFTLIQSYLDFLG